MPTIGDLDVVLLGTLHGAQQPQARHATSVPRLALRPQGANASCQISPRPFDRIYEGTTGIQALDLLGRKVLIGTKGKCVRDFTHLMVRLAKPHLFARGPIGNMARSTIKRAIEWNLLTLRIMLRATKDRDLVGSASFDYLMYSGYVMMGYFWALQATKANTVLLSGNGTESAEFYRAKIQTAEFYFDRLLPRADAHRKSALAPTRSVMQMDNGSFAFP